MFTPADPAEPMDETAPHCTACGSDFVYAEDTIIGETLCCAAVVCMGTGHTVRWFRTPGDDVMVKTCCPAAAAHKLACVEDLA